MHGNISIRLKSPTVHYIVLPVARDINTIVIFLKTFYLDHYICSNDETNLKEMCINDSTV